MFAAGNKIRLPDPEDALPDRQDEIPVTNRHFVNGDPIKGPFPEGLKQALFGLGCFWGAEKQYWQLQGVYSTAVGYSAGFAANPSYEEVCTGMTGHNEVVLVIYVPETISYENLLKVFWQSHDPTLGMRQGNDVGTQYRSGIYVYDPIQRSEAEQSRQRYQEDLTKSNYSTITTEIIDASEFYYAEDYHQQYLAKNPSDYCDLGGTGVICSV